MGKSVWLTVEDYINYQKGAAVTGYAEADYEHCKHVVVSPSEVLDEVTYYDKSTVITILKGGK